MMNRLSAINLLAATVAIGLAACSSPSAHVEMSDMAGYSWSEPAVFTVDNDDTLSLRELSIVIRYNREFAADSVTVGVATLTPDSLRLEERFTLHIPATEQVRPVERIFPYRTRVRLMRCGQYRFTLSAADTVGGVESVGMMIENVNKD